MKRKRTIELVLTDKAANAFSGTGATWTNLAAAAMQIAADNPELLNQVVLLARQRDADNNAAMREKVSRAQRLRHAEARDDQGKEKG